MLGFVLVRPGHSEDRIAQVFRCRWGRDGDSQNQRNEATGHTAHDTHRRTHGTYTHVYTDSTSGEKTPLHSGPRSEGTTKQRTGARARSAP